MSNLAGVESEVDVALCAVKGLTLRAAARVLARDINLLIKPGSLILIKGGNGVGKTTLLRTIAGLHADYSGVIQRSNALSIGIASSSRSLMYEDLSLIENIAILQHASYQPQILSPSLSRMPLNSLSSGEITLAGFERVLALKPSLMLLDEVTAHLDHDKATVVRAEVRNHTLRGGAAVLVSHEPLLKDFFTAEYILTESGLHATEGAA